jgi:fructose-bisphosphate aldolase class II
MKTLRQYIQDAEDRQVAIGHFNISNLEGLWAIFNAVRKLDVPVVIGVSEGERKAIGVQQAVALIRSLREEYDYPIFLNADHSHSWETFKEAIDAGFDTAIIDGAALPLEESIELTKKCVEYARATNPGALVEGELGYIGTSSKMLDEIPEGAITSGEALVKPETAQRFVGETGIDMLAPAVGNIHGMLKNMSNPRLDIPRIAAIRQAAGVPLVLHGGSGIVDEDFRAAIKNGMSIVHINTEIRVAYRDALVKSLAEHPDEVAPYKYAEPAMAAVEAVVEARAGLFAGKE